MHVYACHAGIIPACGFYIGSLCCKQDYCIFRKVKFDGRNFAYLTGIFFPKDKIFEDQNQIDDSGMHSELVLYSY